MKWMNLDQQGRWKLDIDVDHEGDVELSYRDDKGGHPTWLNTAQMMTLRDLFDSITSRCSCRYDASKRICDEYDTYTLTETNPYCPFHGEKTP